MEMDIGIAKSKVSCGGSSLGLILGIVGGLILVGAIVAIVIKRSKRWTWALLFTKHIDTK